MAVRSFGECSNFNLCATNATGEVVLTVEDYLVAIVGAYVAESCHARWGLLLAGLVEITRTRLPYVI